VVILFISLYLFLFTYTGHLPRVDDASLLEEIDVTVDDIVEDLERMYCIISQLKTRSLKDNRGGQVKDTIASTDIRYASKLQVLNLITSSGNPESSAVLRKQPSPIKKLHKVRTQRYCSWPDHTKSAGQYLNKIYVSI
jgi:hypothetical protein